MTFIWHPTEVIAIDFERAGAAAGSDPIEIGWAHSSALSSLDQSHYIKLNDPKLWDIRAEKNVHKISRECLEKEGLSCSEVAQLCQDAFRGKVILSDLGYEKDQISLNQIFERAGGQSNIKVEGFYNRVCMYTDEILDQAYAKLNLENHITEHRALPDARDLMRLYETYYDLHTKKQQKTLDL